MGGPRTRYHVPSLYHGSAHYNVSEPTLHRMIRRGGHELNIIARTFTSRHLPWRSHDEDLRSRRSPLAHLGPFTYLCFCKRGSDSIRLGGVGDLLPGNRVVKV
jgi:hypothetical protein